MASSYGEDASKTALRSAFDDLPKLSPSHQARLDGDVLKHLSSYQRYKASKLVLVFPSQREECDTLPPAARAEEEGKRVLYAAFDKNGIVSFSEANSKTAVELADEELAASVCLVPGLVFDAEGYRVAYGAGYIDNFLAKYTGCSIAPVRSLQVGCSPLPHDPHDVPVDVLVSDAAIWVCRREA